jgi:ribose transport system permease protein
MATADTYARLRYRLIPDHVLGEILEKDWIDNATPVFFLVVALAVFGTLLPNLLSEAGLADMAGQLGEISLVTLGMTVVMLGGGIDLSVGSVFALSNFISLTLVNKFEISPFLAIPCVLTVCAFVGFINGLLVGYLRLRAFLTTLATLIIVRAVVDELVLRFARVVSASSNSSSVWEYLWDGQILGIPFVYAFAVVMAIACHVMLSRMRIGWQILAVGGSRRSAYNAGISVKRVVCSTYVMSAVLTGLGGVLYAARLNSTGSDTGSGLEVVALTAAVLGGISLGGGRGTAVKAMLGAFIVLIVINSLMQLNMPSGSTPLVLGVILLIGVAVDVKWTKNRHKLTSRVYVSPTYLRLPDCPETAQGSDSPYALNDRLREVDAIGLGELDGPEDIIFDRAGNIYTGSRHGDIIRFFGPEHKVSEVFAHVGGFPLGLAFDKEDSLYVCISGMGLYKITQQREVIKLSDRTSRSLFSVIDDSRIKLADDLDIAPDGKVFFSEATIRYEVQDWIVDALESRTNGRILCYDPKTDQTKTVLSNLVFPNGICVNADGESLLFSETWACTVKRYWFDGPRKGRVEVLIKDLPGYPDNLNRASDGTIWCALAGMRSPVFDLTQRRPAFRRKMARLLSGDEWIFPNVNTGCVLRFDLEGRVLESLWDLGGQSHPQITSMREHKGYLYLGGISNNRIGRYRLQGMNRNWTSQESYWGKDIVVGQ